MAARLLDDANGEGGADDRLEDEELGGDVDMDEGAVGEEGAVGLLLDLGVAQQHAVKAEEEDIRIGRRSGRTYSAKCWLILVLKLCLMPASRLLR